AWLWIAVVLVLVIVSMFVFASRNLNAANDAFQHQITRELGFIEPPTGFMLAGLRLNPSFRHPLREEIGLIGQGAGGLVFLGWRGSRLTFPIANVSRVEPGRGIRRFPRTFIYLAMKNGETWRFEPMSGGSFAANRAAARALIAGLKG
ncbi:MAG: hypothetical protein ACAI25_07775, partial [Planctomycetota bacterium]